MKVCSLSRVAIRLFLGLALPGVAAAAADTDELRKYADVAEWRGDVQYQFHYTWNQKVGEGTLSGETIERGVATMHLDQPKIGTTGIEWRGTGTTRASVRHLDRLATAKGGFVTTVSSSGTFVHPNNWLGMDLVKGTLHAGAGGGKSVDCEIVTEFRIPGVKPSRRKTTWNTSANVAVQGEPLPKPAPGMLLSGSKSVDLAQAHNRFGHQPFPGKCKVTASWTFAPVWRDVELVVTVDGYDDWAPKATAHEHVAGNTLTARATLRSKDGKPLPYQAKRITFELKDTSAEPGVCMNWPQRESITKNELFDLRFEPEKNREMTPADENLQKISTAQGKHTTASAVVSCYDWGARSDLMVTAELPDGRMLVGHLEGKPETILVPLPKRTGGSYIADAWKRNRPGSDDDDGADNDHVAHNEHDGDGFSNYEEYRGFYVNRKHVSTEPGTKDLFILDQVGGQAVRGFMTFKRATGIEVHWQLRPAEMRASRVMNFNRSERSPKSSDEHQHGLIVRMWEKEFSHVLTEKTGPTVPKHVEALEISFKHSPYAGWLKSIVRDGAIVISDMSGGTISAHEMSHACGVWHHGEAEPGFRLWRRDAKADPPVIREFALDLEGSIVETDDDPHKAGTIIRVYDETMRQYPPEDPMFDADRRIWVGVSQGGQHSGDEDCYMRYKVAGAYTMPRNPQRFRVLVVEGETLGSTLCKSPAGTGVNAGGRKPFSRYGDASGDAEQAGGKRGDCRAQVNCRDSSVP